MRKISKSFQEELHVELLKDTFTRISSVTTLRSSIIRKLSFVQLSLELPWKAALLAF